jgi:maltooligosyltrehalose trehalohydrolase
MLFQGQEFGSSKPFVFFADHGPQLDALVEKGRREFMAQFANMTNFGMVESTPNPGDPATFARCKLDHREREQHPEAVALHRDLLKLRREDPAFRAPRRLGVDGAILGPNALVLRFFVEDGADRLFLLNLGSSFGLRETPEPLLAPPEGLTWSRLWSSEEPRYGGSGHAPIETDDGWHIPGEAAVVLKSVAP